MSGVLWLVATPIGNLEDITLRALRVLREADVVLAEDTRRTKTLLAHYQIDTRLESVHAHTSDTKIVALAERLVAGERFALVTDAGTPIVSDPGEALVSAALAREVRVEAIPGPSAVLTALAVSGLPGASFRFVGFLPRGGKRRRAALDAIASDPLTTILFEAPPRIAATVRELLETCGEHRPAALCRELTKLHEQVIRAPLGELSARLERGEGARGEITLLVSGKAHDEKRPAPSDGEIQTRAAFLLEDGLSVKDTARMLAEELGLDRREAYRHALAVRKAPPAEALAADDDE